MYLRSFSEYHPFSYIFELIFVVPQSNPYYNIACVLNKFLDPFRSMNRLYLDKKPRTICPGPQNGGFDILSRGTDMRKCLKGRHLAFPPHKLPDPQLFHPQVLQQSQDRPLGSDTWRKDLTVTNDLSQCLYPFRMGSRGDDTICPAFGCQMRDMFGSSLLKEFDSLGGSSLQQRNTRHHNRMRYRHTPV